MRMIVVAFILVLAGCASLQGKIQALQEKAQKEIQKCANDEACKQKVSDAVQKGIEQVQKMLAK